MQKDCYKFHAYLLCARREIPLLFHDSKVIKILTSQFPRIHTDKRRFKTFNSELSYLFNERDQKYHFDPLNSSWNAHYAIYCTRRDDSLPRYPK